MVLSIRGDLLEREPQGSSEQECQAQYRHRQRQVIGCAEVGGDGVQECDGELIRYRTLTGICNDLWNPKMGSTGTLFSRNAQFESTFPRLQKTDLTIARHSDAQNGVRLGLLKPDPQLISRELFSRQQSAPDRCNDGKGLVQDQSQASCDYQKAPFFNVLAAFWIQFMT